MPILKIALITFSNIWLGIIYTLILLPITASSIFNPETTPRFLIWAIFCLVLGSITLGLLTKKILYIKAIFCILILSTIFFFILPFPFALGALNVNYQYANKWLWFGGYNFLFNHSYYPYNDHIYISVYTSVNLIFGGLLYFLFTKTSRFRLRRLLFD